MRVAFYGRNDSRSYNPDDVCLMVKFAKREVVKALKEASKKAKANIKSEWEGNTGSEYCTDYAVVDEQSILNAYPPENIT